MHKICSALLYRGQFDSLQGWTNDDKSVNVTAFPFSWLAPQAMSGILAFSQITAINCLENWVWNEFIIGLVPVDRFELHGHLLNPQDAGVLVITITESDISYLAFLSRVCASHILVKNNDVKGHTALHM